MTRGAHKKQEGATELKGRLGSWSGSNDIETGTRLKGEKGALSSTEGRVIYFVWRTLPRLDDAPGLLEDLRHRRALQSLEGAPRIV